MKKEKACRNCKRLVLGEKNCPVCGGKKFSSLWKGYVVVVDPAKSKIAQRLAIKVPGRYALQLGH